MKNTRRLILPRFSITGIYVLVFIFSFSIRAFLIESIPSSLTHDELYYVAQARTLAVDGRDPTGSWRPWFLTSAHPLFAELPGVLMAPAALLFTNSLLAARITHVLVGSLIPIVLALLAQSLFKNRGVTIATLLLASINPWLFQQSRQSFDPLFGMFFYLLGMAWLLRSQKWWRLGAIGFFALGFFQYQGFKVLLLPFYGITAAYIWLTTDSKRSIKTSDTLSLIAGGVLLGLLLLSFVTRITSQQAASRINDFIFFDQPYLATKVVEHRQGSIPSLITPWYSNWLTQTANHIWFRAADSINIVQLFVRGESSRNPTSVWSMGSLYPVDGVLILVGFAVLWSSSKWRKQSYFLLAWFLISPLPSVINSNDSWPFLRSSFLIPCFIFLAAVGVVHIWDSATKYRSLIRSGLILAYLLFVSIFTYEYILRYPIYASGGKYMLERVVSSYGSRLPPDKKLVVLISEAEFQFYAYLIYNRLITTNTINDIHADFQNRSYTMGNVTIKTDCLKQDMLSDENNIFIVDDTVQTCESPKENNIFRLRMHSLTTDSPLLTVYNDPICRNVNLVRKYPLSLDVLKIEKIKNETFCGLFFDDAFYESNRL